MLSVIISPLLGSAMTCNTVLQTKSEHHKIDARSTDRRKKPNEKTPHIAGTTRGICTCEADDPEEFSSFLDSFLCRKKMLRKNPPQRRRWNRPRQEDTDKEQYAAARARREEGHDHQINLLRTASGEYSGLQLAQKKRKKKSCESRELTSADRPWLERAKLLCREKSLHDKNDGAEAGDGERRKTTLRHKRRQPKRKTSKESVFRQFLFFFFSEEEGTAPPP